MAKVKFKSLRRLLVYFRPYYFWVAVAFVCVVVVSAAQGATAYLVKPAMDEIFINRDMNMLKLLCVAVIVLYAAKGVFRFSQSYILRRVGQKVIKNVRLELYRHFQFLSIDYYTETSSGIMLSRITNDVQLMQRAIPSLVDLFRQPLTMLGLIGVAFYMNWKMALLVALVFPISALPIIRFGKRVRSWARRGQERMGEMTSVLKENFGGIRVIKAFGMEEYEIDRFSRENENVYQALVRTIVFDELAAPVIELLGAFAAAAVIFLGAMQVFRGETSSGEFFSFLAACGMMYEPIKKLNKVNVNFQAALSAADRIFEVLDTPISVSQKPDAVEMPTVHREVRFENVHFRYGDAWVLKDLNFTVDFGQVVALVGSSGAGKTTIVNLIPRFYDVTEGAIRFDGMDLRDATLHSLRRQIGMVTQEVFLFDDTVRNNIAYGQGEAGEEAIVAAAKAANAHDFIMEMPSGYDTDIGELGVRLSGGERQRLSIARAIFKDAPILILDEATSSLDAESEREVQSALENLMLNRTTFVIAHRLSTIRNADRILVLSDGRIVEDGRHEELMERGGEYRRLYEIQFQDARNGG